MAAMSQKGGNASVEEGKTIAIIAYLTWIGLIIAFVLNNEKKNDFAKFHLRQSLLLNIICLIGFVVFWIPIVGWALGIVLLVLWIIALIGAINGERKEVWLIGPLAQEWFKGI
jgi:uncharacterized membrane protein